MKLSREGALWRLIAKHKPTPAAFAVLFALAAHCDREGLCFPSLDRLAQLTNVSRSTVAEALAFWRRAGVLTTAKGGGRGRTSTYALPALANAAKGPNIGPFAVLKGPVSGPKDPPKQSDLPLGNCPISGPEPIDEPTDARARTRGPRPAFSTDALLMAARAERDGTLGSLTGEAARAAAALRREAGGGGTGPPDPASEAAA